MRIYFELASPAIIATASPLMTSDEALHLLDKLISNRSILEHPFYLAWRQGELTKAQLATYARVYYSHVLAFPSYLRNAIHCASDVRTRQELENNLADELGSPAPHSELWLDFAQAMGAERATVKRSSPPSKAAEAISIFEQLTRRDCTSGLSALYAYESQQPSVAEEKIRGLRFSYGITDCKALSYFTVHATTDLEHRRAERESLARCLHNGESAEKIMVAAKESLDAYWHLLDGVCEEAGVELSATT
jgi:pyrroloquinoline-quinone synthase